MCFWTKSQFMNIPVAPESRSANVVTGRREVADRSMTVRFREWGEFLDNT